MINLEFNLEFNQKGGTKEEILGIGMSSIEDRYIRFSYILGKTILNCNLQI